MTDFSVKPAHGSVEYYKEHFDDLLCDIGCSPQELDNALEGLMQSLEEWVDYYRQQAQVYKDFGVKLAERIHAL